MTAVQFDVDVDTAVGLANADGAIVFEPHPGHRYEDDTLVVPGQFQVRIPTTSTFTVPLAPTTNAWCWRVHVRTRKGGGGNVEDFYVQVPDSETTVQFKDLTQ